MKKHLLLLIILNFFIIYECAPADAYIFGTFGSGGEVDAASFGGEIGGIWPRHEPKYLLGFGVSWADSGWERREKAYQSPRYRIGKARDYGYNVHVKTDELEIHGTAGFSLMKNIFIVGTAGASGYCEHTANEVSIHLKFACEGSDGDENTSYFAGSGQLRYVNKGLIIGVGYHNRRGIIGGIGLSFL